MTVPIKPCKLGPRHKWAWQKNVASSQIGGRGAYAYFILRGLYRCECGAKKVGAPSHNGADLRDLFQPPQESHP